MSSRPLRGALVGALLAGLFAPTADAQRDAFTLDRGWRTVALGPGEVTEDSTRWRRASLPFADRALLDRLVFQRELRAPRGLRDRRARVVLEHAWPAVEAFLDGEPAPVERRGFETVVDLGRGLQDGAAHELLLVCGAAPGGPSNPEAGPAPPAGIAGGARLEFVGDHLLDFDQDQAVAPLAWRWSNADDAVLDVAPTVVNAAAEPADVVVRATLEDGTGCVVASADVRATVAGGGEARVPLALAVAAARAWTAEAPQLYGLTVELATGGEPVDRRTAATAPRPFGGDGWLASRALVVYFPGAFDRDRGESAHAHLPPRAQRRDAARLAELGAAVELDPRSEPSEAFLDECDRRGVEVALPSLSSWPAARRRALAARAAAHPCAVVVSQSDWSRGRSGQPTASDGRAAGRRTASAAERRAFARDFVADALRRAPGDPPPSGGGAFGGALTSDRLPTFAYHRLRAALDRPTAYPAAEWSDVAAGGELVVYASGDAVEVFVDGASLGRRRPYRGVARFAGAPAAERDVLVRAWRGGWVDAERRLAAPGPPAQVLLVADQFGLPLSATASDRLWVHALVLDEFGNLCSDFDGELRVSLLGAGEFVGEPRPRALAGVASVVVRATGPDPMTVAVAATADDVRLASSALTLVPEGH